MVARPPAVLWPLFVLIAVLALLPASPTRAPLWTASFDRPVAGLAFSPDGQTLAVTTGARGVFLYNARTGTEQGRLEAPSDCFTVRFSSDGKRLFLRGYDGLVQYELAGSRQVLRVAGPLAAGAVTADGRGILTGENLVDRGGRCEDYFLDAYRDGEKTWTEHGEGVCVDTLLLPPEGDRYLVLWRNKRVVQGWGLGAAHEKYFPIGFGTCRFSPDGTRIAYRARETHELKLLDGRTAQPVVGPVTAPANSSLSFSADGERLVASGRGLVQAYGARQLNEQGRLVFNDAFLESSFIDDRMVVSYTSEGRWLVWDAGTGKIQRQPDDSVPRVTQVAGYPGVVAIGGHSGPTGVLKVFPLR